MLLSWFRKRQVAPAGFFGTISEAAERRGAVRHDVQFDVLLRRDGIAPVMGAVINISRSGAAIRIHGWNPPVPAAWPTRLNHGDEVWLVGLFDLPLFCWVIAVDENVLRVHFSLDDRMRRQLGEMIAALPDRDTESRH
jgi:hypothetical protein